MTKEYEKFSWGIAEVCHSTEDSANAKLISAAPDMFRALELLVDDGSPIRYNDRKAVAIAALKKAKG